jgi:hypothetical protein
MYDASFLKGEVRQSIHWDVVDFAYSATGNGAGWFGVPRQVFCFVDFLGGVAFPHRRDGKPVGSTRRSVRFLREYFPSDYNPVAELLVAMWRHGTVHGFMPDRYYTTRGNRRITVVWSSNNDWAEHNQAVNLQFFDIDGQPDAVCLSVNMCALAGDLMDAFDRLLNRRDLSPSFERGCISRLNRLMESRYIWSATVPMCRSDKSAIESQILYAHDHWIDGRHTRDVVRTGCPCLTSASLADGPR